MEQHLTVARTARYQQLGEPSAATRQLWLVAHGYGQLAEYFGRHFAFMQALDPVGTVVVAPEALSRFYLNGTSGRVGASWMTRADRLAELADQAAYLDSLLAHVLDRCPTNVRVTVMGFSQGTATVSRWLAGRADQWRPAQLVLWAGDFPADIEEPLARQLLHKLPVALVSGQQDEYVSPDTLHQQAASLRQCGAQVTLHRFAGGHTLHPDTLRQLYATPLV